jgi:uncharacterized protein YndB with AHSA1/START domain
MGVARQRADVVLPPERAMALWVDPGRLSTWVDGFGRFAADPVDWPAPGAKLIWESRPGGRGRVTERVVAHEPPRRFVADVFEERMAGRQTVFFEPEGDGSRVTIQLDYALTRGGPVQAIADLLFIRPRLRESLRRTLRRFATEVAEEAGLHQL